MVAGQANLGELLHRERFLGTEQQLLALLTATERRSHCLVALL